MAGAREARADERIGHSLRQPAVESLALVRAVAASRVPACMSISAARAAGGGQLRRGSSGTRTPSGPCWRRNGGHRGRAACVPSDPGRCRRESLPLSARLGRRARRGDCRLRPGSPGTRWGRHLALAAARRLILWASGGANGDAAASAAVRASRTSPCRSTRCPRLNVSKPSPPAARNELLATR